MQFLTIRMDFEPFESKFEPLKGIQSIRTEVRKGFETFEYKF